ncbi:magnesium-translocating P-type ATPase [Pandoraea anhela]|uniref:Magnesium-translocating P-type ATPase n=2 Tax=Pandoraea anhela TaxID=2508295 RepID=A0A5E4Z7X7_9BURK|nr:magnesium-translocating P-type ATPase [Pandoraea anhela]
MRNEKYSREKTRDFIEGRLDLTVPSKQQSTTSESADTSAAGFKPAKRSGVGDQALHLQKSLVLPNAAPFAVLLSTLIALAMGCWLPFADALGFLSLPNSFWL